LPALNTKGKMRLSILQKTAEEFDGKSKEKKNHPLNAKLQSVFDSPSQRKTLERTDRHNKEATKTSKKHRVHSGARKMRRMYEPPDQWNRHNSKIPDQL
jgi:hypothetical protein